ncbi:hypothetical protein ACTG9Q_10990 [Actinokineospora sp. 24-640]
MSEIGWMAGVFRQRKHWVSDITRNFQHEYGITYYANCGAPCLDAADLRRLWWNWEACAICVASLMEDIEWWFSPLQDNVVHARENDALAVCGSILAAEVTDIANRHDLAVCRACLAEFTDG